MLPQHMKIPCWEQNFWLLAKASLARHCSAVFPYQNADTTARIRLYGAPQTHRKPFTGGELRVSSSVTEKTTVLGVTTVPGGTWGEPRVSSSITEKTTDLGSTTVLGGTLNLTNVRKLGWYLGVLRWAGYTYNVRLLLRNQSLVFGLRSCICHAADFDCGDVNGSLVEVSPVEVRLQVTLIRLAFA